MSQPAPMTETESTAPQPSARANFHEVYLNAGKVFELIDRHQTPPDPQTYAMWYAYVTGQNDKLNEQIDAALSAKGQLSAFEIDNIYQDLVYEDSIEAARQSLSLEVGKEIETALQIIQQGAKTSKDYSETLKKASAELPASVADEDAAAVVTRLLEENLRMSQTTQELSAGLQESQSQIASLNKKLEEVQAQSTQDPLTATSNRRAFDTRLAQEIQNAEESGDSFCLVMADIDHFKTVNDTYGHPVGDTVLQMFATVISNNIKGKDMIARLGGEEFGIILPQTELIPAYNFLVKIKHLIKGTRVPVDSAGKDHASVTGSFGIAAWKIGMTAEDLISAADHWLYEAKNSGRDKVCARGL